MGVIHPEKDACMFRLQSNKQHTLRLMIRSDINPKHVRIAPGNDINNRNSGINVLL